MKMPIPREKQKLVYVKWQDASHNSGWFSIDKLKELMNFTIPIMEETGWIIYEDKHEIHLVNRRITWDIRPEYEESEYGHFQRIPKTWLMEIQEIKG